MCGLTNVRHVLSIISEGVVTESHKKLAPWTYQGKTYWVPVKETMTTVSLLANRLYPPDVLLNPPNYALETSSFFFLSPFSPIIWWAMTICGFLPFLLIIYGVATRQPLEFNFMGILVSLALTLIGILALPFALSQKRREKHVREWKQREIKYHRARDRFSRLRYCYTCDLVFDPEDPIKHAVPPEEMYNYLFAD
jgi:hypothetical protein